MNLIGALFIFQISVMLSGLFFIFNLKNRIKSNFEEMNVLRRMYVDLDYQMNVYKVNIKDEPSVVCQHVSNNREIDHEIDNHEIDNEEVLSRSESELIKRLRQPFEVDA